MEEAERIGYRVNDGVLEWQSEEWFEVEVDKELFEEIVPNAIEKYSGWTPNDLSLIMEMCERLEIGI